MSSRGVKAELFSAELAFLEAEEESLEQLLSEAKKKEKLIEMIKSWGWQRVNLFKSQGKQHYIEYQTTVEKGKLKYTGRSRLGVGEIERY